MSAPVFVLLTDAESLHNVAVNLDAIEVIEERDEDSTWVQTAQHSVVVRLPLDEVMGLLLDALANASGRLHP